jgi:hypothetical protein
MVYVASRFEISRRREILSWSHHETLAALDVDRQDYWLDRASAERLSVSDLRVELRSSRPGWTKLEEGSTAAQTDDESPATAASATVVVCPRCGDEVPIPEELLKDGTVLADPLE